MGKDPLERERHFRQSIEGWALARRQSRGFRRWLGWTRPLLFNVLLFVARPWLAVLLITMCFGGLFVFIFGVGIKWTNAYACSLAEARRNSAVVEELGEPIEAGFFAWTYGYSLEGSVTNTSFGTTLVGPKGEGTLTVGWYSSPVGSSLQMELEKDGQTRRVYSGAIPCR